MFSSFLSLNKTTLILIIMRYCVIVCSLMAALANFSSKLSDVSVPQVNCDSNDFDGDPCKPGVVGLTPGFSSLSDEALNRVPMTIVQDKLLPRKYCDEPGDYAVPDMLSLRDLVFRYD